MLPPMPQLSQRCLSLLGVLVALALLAHGLLLAPGLEAPASWLDPARAPAFVHLALMLVTGRVLLSFFPPGGVGGHAWSELAVTAATSLVLGCLTAWLLEPLDGPAPFWPVLLLALARWLTLPGAMVPRHAPRHDPTGPLDLLAAGAGVVWAAYTARVDALALSWLALFVLVFHALGVARRRRAGRYAVLALGALLLVPPGALRASPVSGFAPALSLGCGASFLIPWLRRADRRAGLLSALGFGSAFLAGLTALALAGPAVMLWSSHARQRRFAALALGACALPFLLVGLQTAAEPARGRLLWLPEVVSTALDVSSWGLAWPLVLLALVLGASTFPWRGPAWSPGSIEEPRREARALSLLIVLAGTSCALPSSPWTEVDALIVLFPPCALLAGLLLIPPERSVAGA